MKHGIRLSSACAVAAVLLLLAGAAWAGNGTAGPSPTAPVIGYVGADTCKSCHEDLYKQFESTPHYKTLLDTRGGAPHQGCEACHGGGEAHVNGGGDVSKIFRFKQATAKVASDRCLECHNRDDARTNFRRSAHHAAQVACTDCHSVHKPRSEGGQFLLAKAQPVLCYSCHQEVKSEFMRPFRHRIQEGLLECNDCHNEHGGFNRKSLRSSAAQDQVCFKCHADKQGPFVYEHMPVRTEGCTSCHSPHGSSNPRMLKRAQVNQLCTDCHANWFGTPSVPTHNQAQRYQACTLCHSQIHGSNTDVRFFK
jgi:DmsE family decaheme c-type cytochrome